MQLCRADFVVSADGGLLIEPFLVLPSRREWPQYYAIIDKPIAFDTIQVRSLLPHTIAALLLVAPAQKKLKKKSYRTTNDFGADVELLFDNALKFNEDNSAVWIAAQTLRPFFHKLMADLPAEYAYTPPVATPPAARPKIKIKVGGRGKPDAKSVATPSTPAESASTAVAVPAPATATKSKAPAAVATPVAKPPTRAAATAAAAVPPATPAPAVRKPPPAPSYATPINKATGVPSAGLPRPGAVLGTPGTNAKPMYSQPPNYTQLRPPPITYQQPQSMVSLVTSGIATPPIAPRSPSPELMPMTTIKRVSVIASPSKRTIQLAGTPWGSSDLAPVRCFAVRLGRNETSLQLKVEAEKPDDDEDEMDDTSEVEAKDASEHGVMVDGKKFPVEIKCNGTFLTPAAAKEGAASAAPTLVKKASSDVDVDGDEDPEDDEEDGAIQMNGHADDDEDSGSENESHSPSKPAVRATRSGRVIAPAGKNGKVKRRRKSKKGLSAASRVLVDLGQWDVSLNVGSNVLDIKAGGKDGESWRVFVDRVL